MKKVLSLFLILLLAGCAAPASSAPPTAPAPPMPNASVAPPPPEREELTTVRWWIVYWTRLEEYDKKIVEDMADALNPYLETAGLRLEIVVGDYRDAEEYVRMIPGVLASEEKYDLISLYSDFSPLQRWIAEGYFKDFGGELDAHRPILDALDPLQLELARTGGSMRFIPSTINYFESKRQSCLFMEESIAASLNIESVTSLDELTAAMQAAHEADLPSQVRLYYTALNEFRREDPEFPCAISDDLLFLYDDQGGVSSYAHSDVFLRDAERMRTLRGAVPDALFFPTIWNIGKYDTMRPFIFSPGNRRRLDRNDEATQIVQLSPEKPQIFFSNPYGLYVSVIPAYAEAGPALRFLDWAYGSLDNYSMLCYGVEGTHYRKADDGGMTRIEGNPFSSLSQFIGQRILNDGIDSIMNQNVDPTSVWARMANREGYELMPWNGFVFDPTPVQQVYGRVTGRYLYNALHLCSNVPRYDQGLTTRNGLHGVTAYMWGEVPMDDFNLKLAELDEAGLPDVLEECRKQYADYLAAIGWIQ